MHLLRQQQIYTHLEYFTAVGRCVRDGLKINYGVHYNKETCQSLQQWLIDVFLFYFLFFSQQWRLKPQRNKCYQALALVSLLFIAFVDNNIIIDHHLSHSLVYVFMCIVIPLCSHSGVKAVVTVTRWLRRLLQYSNTVHRCVMFIMLIFKAYCIEAHFWLEKRC